MTQTLSVGRITQVIGPVVDVEFPPGQLPAILTFQPYRSGFISLHYVFGMIILGLLLFLASIQGLRTASAVEK